MGYRGIEREREPSFRVARGEMSTDVHFRDDDIIATVLFLDDIVRTRNTTRRQSRRRQNCCCSEDACDQKSHPPRRRRPWCKGNESSSPRSNILCAHTPRETNRTHHYTLLLSEAKRRAFAKTRERRRCNKSALSVKPALLSFSLFFVLLRVKRRHRFL